MQNFKDFPKIWVLIIILLVTQKLSLISFLSKKLIVKKLLKYIMFDFWQTHKPLYARMYDEYTAFTPLDHK